MSVTTSTASAFPSEFRTKTSNFLETTAGIKTTVSPREIKRTTVSVLTTLAPEIKRTTSPKFMATTVVEQPTDVITDLKLTTIVPESMSDLTTLADFKTTEQLRTAPGTEIPTPANIRSMTESLSPKPTLQSTSPACNCTNGTTMVTVETTDASSGGTTQPSATEGFQTDEGDNTTKCICGVPPPTLPEFPQRKSRIHSAVSFSNLIRGDCVH